MPSAARTSLSGPTDAAEEPIFSPERASHREIRDLDGVTIVGRADVILDHEGGVPTALAILDYKTSAAAGAEHGLQLQVYADAGRREGLDVRGAYVHDLKAGARLTVDVDEAAVASAETKVQEAAGRLRGRDYTPSPGPQCRSCEVRTVCRFARL